MRKIIILTSLSLLFILTVGYSAFQTNLNISAKGNILEKGITIEELKNEVVISGDGLYKDTYETNRYIYKGAEPDNYITFNDELWRILSVESDGTIKIIKNDSLGNLVWDAVGTRNSSTSTYCINSSSYGCNAWAATVNLVNSPSVFTLYFPNGSLNTATDSFSGTVTVDSSLKTYLNNDYYNSIKEKKYIVSHKFDVGTPGTSSDTEDIATNLSQESLYKCNDEVGLMTVTEVLMTTTNLGCNSLKVGVNNFSKSICSENNWMWLKSGYEWTISPYANSNRRIVWLVNGEKGYLSTGNADGPAIVRPILYLKSGISLSGEGTESNPYKIIS